MEPLGHEVEGLSVVRLYLLARKSAVRNQDLEAFDLFLERLAGA
jgi:hypothetical protein